MIIPPRILSIVIVLISIGLAIWLGSISVDLNFDEVLMLLVGGVAIWCFFAGNNWWIILPPAIAFGGFFYCGFKVYFQEIALVLTLLPLLPLAVLGSRKVTAITPIPRCLILLTLFMLLHTGWSLSQAGPMKGSVARVCLNGLWPLFFSIGFYLRGNNKAIQPMLILLYIALLLRIGIEVFTYFTPNFIYIPALSFVPSQGWASLRYSAFYLFVLSFALLLIGRRFYLSIYHSIIALGCVGLFIFGGGRSLMLAVLALPFVWLALYRRWVWICSLFFLLLAGIGFLNLNPGIIENLPTTAQRSLSVLIVKQSSLQIQIESESSNEWHTQLIQLAFTRLLQSPIHFLFGNRLESFTDLINAEYHRSDENFSYHLDIAARCGAYESGVATILGVYGTVGLALYLWCFVYCIKDVLPNLIEYRMNNLNSLVSFLAISMSVAWIVVCIPSGGLPSHELMWAMVAKKLWMDQQRLLINVHGEV